jgi:phage portal protein BeeE
MGWWDRWVWSRVANREALTLEQLLASEATPTAAGVPVTTDHALRLSAVWACVRLLADAVSTLPLDVYRRGDRDPLSELPPLLRQPAAGMSLNEWLYAVMVSLLLRGNAYGIVTGRSGSTLLPAQVDLAHPDRLGVTVTPDGRVQYRLNGEELLPDDVWHVRAYTFPGAVLGLSPVEYARQTIGLGLAARSSPASTSPTPYPPACSTPTVTPAVRARRNCRPNGWPPGKPTGRRPCSTARGSSRSA